MKRPGYENRIDHDRIINRSLRLWLGDSLRVILFLELLSSAENKNTSIDLSDYLTDTVSGSK